MKGSVYKIGFFITLIFSSAQFISAQSNLEFVENKGQWDKRISFKGELNIGSFALKPDGGYRMLLYNQDDLAVLNAHTTKYSSSSTNTKSIANNSEGETLRGHVYEVKFLNANPNPVAVPDKALNSYNNYYIGKDSTKWATRCKIYQAVTYKDVYPNVDVRYYTTNGSLKYDLIVNPGGNPDNITMYFDGADNIKTKNGQLVIQTSVYEMKEGIPEAYSISNTNKDDAECNYLVKGNIVKFQIKKPTDKSSTLVIDPQLVFSTFSGSTVTNWGYTATYDKAGNFYLGGIVFGTGFPVSNGAFQTKFAGGSNTGEGGAMDIGIMKFDPGGTTRIYGTYVGGASGNEYPHSMVCDNNNDLVFSGKTTSKDYPGTLKGSGGSFDIVLTKFNADGTALVGSLIIGGSGDDGVNIRNKYPTDAAGNVGAISTRRNYGDDSRSEVIVDGSNNVYLASCTQSTDFPTVNAFQTAIGGTNSVGRAQDGVFIKCNANLSTILCSTYLGGSDDDAPFVLAINPSNNNVYIAGGTASNDLPGARVNSLFTSNQGQVDGFICVLSNDGQTLIQTSYWGTSAIDLIYGIQFDKFNYPYIMGTTTGTWPVVNAGYSVAGGRQFIAKLKPDLSDWIYSTTFGTANSLVPNISPTAFLVDRCEQAYVSGWGGLGNTYPGYPSAGTTGLPITPDAIQKTTDNDDFYFFVLGKNASSQIFGSFFGQNKGQYPDHVDGGTSRFDRNGVIYQAVCANCGGGAVFPTGPPGVWSPSNGAAAVGGCNMAGIKIAFNLAGVAAGIQAAAKGVIRDTSGCVPLPVDFTDTIALATKYIWDFGDGSAQVTTTAPKVSYTYSKVGFYKVMEIAVDSNSCNISDTSYVRLRVRNDEAQLAVKGAKMPPCTSLTYQFINYSTPPPGKPFSKTSFKIDFGDGSSQIIGLDTVLHTYAAVGTYNVRLVLLDTNYCNNRDSITYQVRLSPNVKAQFTTPSTGCNPYTALFTNTSIGGLQFFWDFGDGGTSTQTNPSHTYPAIGTYTVKMTAVDSSTCNTIDSTQSIITVYGKPTAAFVASPQPPITNTAINFTNNTTGGTLYKFYFGDGDSSITTSVTQLVSHIYNSTGTFNACLYAYNAAGCIDSICQNIQTSIIPDFDIPNSFTPNGDGINDKIYVRGFGITKMKWNIYNRWGTLVYQSSDKSVGWDGIYQGKVQPQDVYHYVLEIELSDGTKYTKKGDITLLR